MRRKWILYTAFFLFLAIGFYVVMTKVIPGYGDVKLPVLSYVQPFSFTNQDGQGLQKRIWTEKYTWLSISLQPVWVSALS